MGFRGISIPFLGSVVGVLKSILQIFFGLYAFDRLVMNWKNVLGIALSLIGGTIFSYLEYTSKQTVDRETVPLIKNPQT